MKYRGYARIYELYLLVFVFFLPLIVLYIFDVIKYFWTAIMLIIYGVMLLLILLRASWMAALEAKFKNLHPISIRMVLIGIILLVCGYAETSVNGSGQPETLFGKGALVSGSFFILFAVLGTQIQAFFDSIKALSPSRKDD